MRKSAKRERHSRTFESWGGSTALSVLNRTYTCPSRVVKSRLSPQSAELALDASIVDGNITSDNLLDEIEERNSKSDAHFWELVLNLCVPNLGGNPKQHGTVEPFLNPRLAMSVESFAAVGVNELRKRRW